MHNQHQKASHREKLDVIVHLTEQPIILRKQPFDNRFTTTDSEKPEIVVDMQQQNVLKAMSAMNIHFEKLHTYKMVMNAIVLRVESKAINRILSIKGVHFVEPNIEVKAMSLATADNKTSLRKEFDPIYSQIQTLWSEGVNGENVKVAVLDSGIDKNHPDLKDVYKGGVNFIDQSNREVYIQPRDDYDPSETSPNDRSKEAPEKYPTSGNPFETYHGTHIAGIVAGNNQNGVKGVAPKIDLYAYRVLGAYTTGDISTIIKGIEEAVVQKMDVINLSLSDDSDSESHALSIAINNAVLAGVVAVSTAGNAGSVRGSIRAPGTSRLGIAVGNSTLSDQVDGSSSRGPSRPHFDIKPDIVAPGTEVLSTMPRYNEKDPITVYEDAYKWETGTSQAAPYIAGVAALIKQANPDFSPFDIKVAMSNTAKVLNTDSYGVFDQGAGRIQPYAAAHPTILAYTIEHVDKNGEEDIVENKKGAITFGAVKLNEPVSITQPIIVKDITGDGGIYDVTIQVTQPFDQAQITVNQSSFTLDGEYLLQVTLTADKNENPQYRDEILGYIHIEKRDQSVHVSLPFAADFSDGATVTPAIEKFSITHKDISFHSDLLKDKNEISLSINSDLSYPSLEIINFLTKEPVDSLFYSNGISLGTRQFPLLHKYTSSWTNEGMTLEDGIYSIDFTGMSKATLLTNSIGPVFIKSKKTIITGSTDGSHVTGQITDQYIDFNQALTELDEGFDLNEKLFASYAIIQDNKPTSQVPFKLNQDGTYSFKLDSFDRVKIVVTDAAGNKAEKFLD